jgi:hypothetical protein
MGGPWRWRVPAGQTLASTVATMLYPLGGPEHNNHALWSSMQWVFTLLNIVLRHLTNAKQRTRIYTHYRGRQKTCANPSVLFYAPRHENPSLELAISKGPNRVDVTLKMERDPISETLDFLVI